MKLLRLMFSLVLMLAIPFLGTPALAMPQIPPCPMQSDMAHSMGMSADLAEAIAAGATIVRVGTALFGARLGARQ